MQQEAPQIPHGKIALGVAVRGEGGVAGEGREVGIPMFHSWSTKCTMPCINEYQVRLDVQRFLLSAY